MQRASDRDRPLTAPEPSAVDEIHVRRLSTRAEYLACVQLQRDTWGAQFTELVPLTILLVAQRIGGLLAGAFDRDERLLGFVFGMTGVEPGGRVVHWSDMLAVASDARDTGLGRRLKEFQRDTVRAQGIEVIYWTFDPLVARNAHLNLNRLGARVAEYVCDMYGETDSVLQRGLGTDRFVVAWNITGEAPGPASPSERDVESLLILNPGATIIDMPKSPLAAVRIEIPADINAVQRSTPEQAVKWRSSTREAFLRCMALGYEVTGFYRDAITGRCFYVCELRTDGKNA